MDGTLLHPAAPHHLPPFISTPGAADPLFVVMSIFLVVAVISVGVLYFRLHALPEQMAHRGQKVQFEIVAVLALLALFTHNHLFWIVGLLLALVQLPDFTTPLSSMAQSLGKMAQRDELASPATPLAQPQSVSVDVLPGRINQRNEPASPETLPVQPQSVPADVLPPAHRRA